MDDAATETSENRTADNPGPSRKKATLGIAGMALALIGMIASVAGPHIVEELYPPEKIDYAKVADKASDFVADVAAKTSRKLAGAAKDKAAKLFSRNKDGDGGEEAATPGPSEAAEAPAPAEEPAIAAAATPAPRVSPRERAFSAFRFVGMGGGIFALFLGLSAWVRGEDHRAAAAASVMGFFAMAWVYIIAAIALIVIASIIGAVFD